MKFFKTFAAALMLTSSLTYCMTQKDNINQQFFAAIQAGNYSLVQDLLNNSADVNAQDRDNFTPLHLAALNGYTAIAQLLIDKRADIKAQTIREKATPLHCTAENGHTATAQLLLEKGADVNAQTTNNTTPLFIAAFNSHTTTAHLLIDKGADVKAQDKKNWTALHASSYNGHTATVQLLIDNGADINAQSDINATALDWSSYNGHTATAQLLIDNGADVNVTALRYAATNGHKVTLEMLLSYKAHLPQDLAVNNIVIQAQENRFKLSQSTKFKQIAQLLKKGAYAYPLVKAFVDSKRKKLFKAIASNNIQAVSQLLKDGFTLNTCDKEGNTLLHKAIQASDRAIVDLLLSLGSERYLHKPNKQGVTPLQLLAAHNMIATVFTPRQ